MIINLKFDYNTLCQKVITEQLELHQIKYTILFFGEIKLTEPNTSEKIETLKKALSAYGIEIIEHQKTILVQKIKDVIREMVFNENNPPEVKSSIYISEKIGHSYGYLSNTFSETTYTSIENFLILQKIEYTKQLIINDHLSLTEIAFKLNYSSVAHLSTQFKNTTGITPSAFQRIIKKRKAIQST